MRGHYNKTFLHEGSTEDAFYSESSFNFVAKTFLSGQGPQRRGNLLIQKDNGTRGVAEERTISIQRMVVNRTVSIWRALVERVGNQHMTKLCNMYPEVKTYIFNSSTHWVKECRRLQQKPIAHVRYTLMILYSVLYHAINYFPFAS